MQNLTYMILYNRLLRISDYPYLTSHRLQVVESPRTSYLYDYRSALHEVHRIMIEHDAEAFAIRGTLFRRISLMEDAASVSSSSSMADRLVQYTRYAHPMDVGSIVSIAETCATFNAQRMKLNNEHTQLLRQSLSDARRLRRVKHKWRLWASREPAEPAPEEEAPPPAPEPPPPAPEEVAPPPAPEFIPTVPSETSDTRFDWRSRLARLRRWMTEWAMILVVCG